MTLLRLLTIACCFAASGIAGAPGSIATAEEVVDVKCVEGDWVSDWILYDGRPYRKNEATRIEWTLRDGRISSPDEPAKVKAPDEPVDGLNLASIWEDREATTYTVEPGTAPYLHLQLTKTMETIAKPNGKAISSRKFSMPGIVWVTGDRMLLCLSASPSNDEKDFPKSFTSSPNSKLYLISFSRRKAGEQPKP